MLKRTQAIILQTHKYGDSSLVVQAYTSEWGRRSFLLKGVRKTKRGSRASLFQPFFILDLEVYFSHNRDLNWIKEANLIGPLPAFSSDMVKTSQVMFLTDMLSRTLKEEEKNEQLFSFLKHSIDFLNLSDEASPSYHLIFLFQLTRYLGFYPKDDFSEQNPYFDLSGGAFSRISKMERDEEQLHLGRLWHNSFEASYLTADQVFNSSKSRNLYLDSVLEFYQVHQAIAGIPKSLEIVRTLFD